MPADKVFLNGKLYGHVPDELPEMLGYDYVYQILHTRRHVPLHISEHIEIADTVMRNIYGYGIGITAGEISDQASVLLRANRYPDSAAAVMMRVFPNSKGAPGILLECQSQLLYPRYALWHKRITATVFPCEYIFMGYQTAVSYITSSYVDGYAARNGADAAIIENSSSVLTNIGDEPLFVVKGKDILTSPVEEGAVDSVMRRLVLRAAEKEGMNVVLTPLHKEWLEECDEAFFPTVQGITSIKGFGSRSFYYLAAGKIAEAIEKMSDK